MQEGIALGFVTFYQDLVESILPIHPLDVTWGKNRLVLSSNHQLLVSIPFTATEVKIAIFDINDNEAAGTYSFYSC